jgi:hypothetical protein
LAGLFRISDQPNAEITTWWYATLTRDKHLCMGGFKTRNPRRQSPANRRCRTRNNWVQPSRLITSSNPLMSVNYPWLLQAPLLIMRDCPDIMLLYQLFPLQSDTSDKPAYNFCCG